jgi:hypothetical protein
MLQGTSCTQKFVNNSFGIGMQWTGDWEVAEDSFLKDKILNYFALPSLKFLSAIVWSENLLLLIVYPAKKAVTLCFKAYSICIVILVD